MDRKTARRLAPFAGRAGDSEDRWLTEGERHKLTFLSVQGLTLAGTISGNEQPGRADGPKADAIRRRARLRERYRLRATSCYSRPRNPDCTCAYQALDELDEVAAEAFEGGPAKWLRKVAKPHHQRRLIPREPEPVPERTADIPLGRAENRSKATRDIERSNTRPPALPMIGGADDDYVPVVVDAFVLRSQKSRDSWWDKIF